MQDLAGAVLEHAVEGEGHTTTTHQQSVETQDQLVVMTLLFMLIGMVIT